MDVMYRSELFAVNAYTPSSAQMLTDGATRGLFLRPHLCHLCCYLLKMIASMSRSSCMTDVMHMDSKLRTFLSCQAIFHLHLLVVFMHLKSFAIKDVAQIVTTFSQHSALVT